MGLITGAFSGVLESLLLLVGYILFPITYALFSLFYTLYGSILYVSDHSCWRCIPHSVLRDGKKISGEPDDFQRLGAAVLNFRSADGRDQHELGEHRAQ